jgi:hypothetical protein
MRSCVDGTERSWDGMGYQATGWLTRESGDGNVLFITKPIVSFVVPTPSGVHTNKQPGASRQD